MTVAPLLGEDYSFKNRSSLGGGHRLFPFFHSLLFSSSFHCAVQSSPPQQVNLGDNLSSPPPNPYTYYISLSDDACISPTVKWTLVTLTTHQAAALFRARTFLHLPFVRSSVYQIWIPSIIHQSTFSSFSPQSLTPSAPGTSHRFTWFWTLSRVRR